MGDCGSRSFLFGEIYGQPATIRALDGSKEEVEVEPSHLRDLEHAGFARSTSGIEYELTDGGLQAFQASRRQPPPPEGFTPD
jgi:hypothetical protein